MSRIYLACGDFPFLASLVGFHCICTMWQTSLLYSQLKQIAQNVTTNELINKHRYTYMKSKPEHVQKMESNIQKMESNVQKIESNVQKIESNIQKMESNIQKIESTAQHPSSHIHHISSHFHHPSSKSSCIQEHYCNPFDHGWQNNLREFFFSNSSATHVHVV